VTTLPRAREHSACAPEARLCPADNGNAPRGCDMKGTRGGRGYLEMVTDAVDH
jgi:hypothetical protein